MNVSVHGVPLKPGHVRVSVDGHIQPEASVPVPIPGEIEVVRQAVGSHVAWPRELIIYPTVAVCYIKIMSIYSELIVAFYSSYVNNNRLFLFYLILCRKRKRKCCRGSLSGKMSCRNFKMIIEK